VSDFSNEPDIAYRPKDLEGDIKSEYVELGASIKHDYSTPDTGVVPLSHRRPMWHFMGLWTTFVVGFSYMALGFQIRAGGYSLLQAVGISVFGYLLYTAYALFGSYLGSRAGQTESNPWRPWEPSQKGLFSEWPQRHRAMAVRPANPKAFPSISVMVNSPSMRIGPLLRMVTLAGIDSMLTDQRPIFL